MKENDLFIVLIFSWRIVWELEENEDNTKSRVLNTLFFVSSYSYIHIPDSLLFLSFSSFCLSFLQIAQTPSG